MYQLVACDIDETLYDEGMVAKENIVAIDEFMKKGGKFVLATGRGGFTLRSMLEELHLWGKPDDYLLVNNGALILSCADLKPIFKQGMPHDLAHRLFEFGKQFEICIQVFSEDTLYIWNINDDEKKRLEYFKATSYEILESWDQLKNKEIMKMMFESTDMAYLYDIEHKIDESDQKRLSISYSSNRYMELNDRSIDKGKALAKLAEMLNIKQEDVIAIGDNANDMSMIAYAGLGVCVSNGQEQVKAIADHVTKNDAKHGAVAEVIQQFCLSKEELYEN